jgi:hypothetical protein
MSIAFFSFGLDFVVNYSLRRRVVGLDWGSWLGVAHLSEYLL